MRHRLCTALVALILLVAATPSSAQDVPAVEVGFGFSTYRDLTYETSAPVGWFVAPSFNVNRWFSAAIDVGGNYGGDNDGAEHAFSGGPRFRYNWSRVGIYFQLLGGVATYAGDSNAILQSGLGFDVHLSPAWALRAETAGRTGNLDGESDTRWRGAFGLVYRTGSR